MSDISKLTQWFLAQVGVKETGQNNVIYNTHYYGGEVDGSQYPWCCAFIWDGFRETGLSRLFVGGGKTAYCPYVVSYAQNHGQWVTDGFKEGDILLYDWDGDGAADHIGYVISWNGGSGVVVEGNYGDAVRKLNRSMADVLGAYRPAYSNEGEVESAKDAGTENESSYGDIPAKPASGPASEVVDGFYTVKRGDTLIGIARKTLGDANRYKDIQRANGLVSTIIYPGQRLKIPGAGEDTTLTEYTVKSGDTLWKIAELFLGSGMKYKEIMSLNGLLSDRIVPGQKLKLPEK